jgi:transcriptional regulator with XRE-family HTH domain
MAEMLDIAQSAYAYIESGKTTLSIDRLIRITEILEMDIHQIIEESLMTRHTADQQISHTHFSQKIIFSETKEVYDLLILELRNEIEFLRSIIRKT